MAVFSKRSFIFLASVISMTLACNLPINFSGNNQAMEEAALTLAAKMTEDEVARIAAIPSDTPTIEPTPSVTPEPSITPSPTIVHLTNPGSPPEQETYLTDLSSKSYAAERRAIADNFNRNVFERPFTSQAMDYQDYLDITRCEISVGAPWFYFTIFLEGAIPAETQATYAIEIDVDKDGRGDWLVSALAPASSEWTTAGVRAYQDTDNDVGGPNPVTADNPLPNLNGYDQMIFDQGQGADPDAAWARRDPGSATRIQVAFKQSLIGSPGQFLWGAWSDEGVKNPEWLDYNDHFSIEQAGSPASNSNQYPLKEFALVDNTCRWAYGFKPSGAIPGLCQLPTPTPTIEPTKPPVCQEPPLGCPVFAAVKMKWNPKTCQCELPTP